MARRAAEIIDEDRCESYCSDYRGHDELEHDERGHDERSEGAS